MKRLAFLALWAGLLTPAWGRTAVDFVEVGGGLVYPVAITHAGDGSGRLFVVELEGRVRIFKDGEVVERPFLDIASRVLQDGEGGLLGIAFHPRFRENRRFFVFYSSLVEDSIRSVVAEYRASEDDPDVASPEEKRLLEIDHPARIHFGGDLKFGPDGYLYISSGDASQGEPAQDGDSLLGKILRIDVDGGDPYGVPPGNPFVGNPDYRPEIWALGFRNPWRIALDSRTGELYVGDVGTRLWEEINLVKPGRNYGWPRMEGFDCSPMVTCDPAEFEPPVIAYDHRDAGGVAAVIGGVLYRGASPDLYGGYLYSDFVSHRIWELRDGADGWTSREIGRPNSNLSAYGKDESGEVYALDFNRGRILKMTVHDKSIFAHLGGGPYPGGRLVSELALGNPWDRPIELQLRTYSPDGAPLAFRIGEEETSVSTWALPPRTSRTLRLEADQLQTGWLSLESDREIGATLRVLWLDDQGEPRASVALEPSVEACQYVVEGKLDAASGVSAGVAVANPFPEDSIEADIELIDAEGEVVASQTIQLDGLHQSAQVLESIAPELQSFAGTIRVQATRPVLVTTVATRGGLATGAVRGSGFCPPPPGSVTRASVGAALSGKEKR